MELNREELPNNFSPRNSPRPPNRIFNMNLPSGKCIKCGEDFLNCCCEQFHPNMVEQDFLLDRKEISALLDYFYKRAGYLSYEFDMEVHRVVKRMEDYVK